MRQIALKTIAFSLLITTILCIPQQCGSTNQTAQCPNHQLCNAYKYCQCQNGFIFDCQTPASQINETVAQYTFTENQQKLFVIYPVNNQSIYFYQFNFCQSSQYKSITYQLALYSDKGESNTFQEKNKIGAAQLKERKVCWSIMSPFLKFESLQNGAIERLILRVTIVSDEAKNEEKVDQNTYRIAVSVLDNGFIDLQILWIILFSFIGLTGLSIVGGIAYCVWWIKIGRYRTSHKNNISHLQKFFPKVKLTQHNINELKGQQINCIICLIEFQLKDEIRKLKCNHIYHSKCLDEWCQIKLSCPACRKSLNLTDLQHQAENYSLKTIRRTTIEEEESEQIQMNQGNDEEIYIQEFHNKLGEQKEEISIRNKLLESDD